MIDNKHAEVDRIVNAHGKSIDNLHDDLKKVDGMNHEKLQEAVTRYKSAHQTFHDDAQGCVG